MLELSMTHIAFFLIAPVFYILIGQTVFSLAKNLFPLDQNKQVESYPEFPIVSCLALLGLFLHMALLFLLLKLGVDQTYALYLPFSLGLLSCRSANVREVISRLDVNFNFFIWFAVVFGLGLTLFEYRESIFTAWKNNYGDLAFHLGMISSFAYSGNFEPNYHLFAGERLTYPFLPNLLTALIWGQNQSFASLAAIFCLQWTLLWIAAYYLLNGNKFIAIPWVLLFGGGSLLLGPQNSGELIPLNQPWTAFLTTVWIPQRTALFGLVGLLAAVRLFLLFRQSKERCFLFMSCLVLGLMPLVHAHFFLVAALFIALVRTFDFFVGLIKYKEELNSFLKAQTKVLGAFLPLFICFIWLPWLLGKAVVPVGEESSYVGKLMLGWLTGDAHKQLAGLERLTSSLDMWAKSTPVLFFVFLLLWIFTRAHILFFSMIALFLIGNSVQLSFWEWDQIKFFIALYAIVFAIWVSYPYSKTYYKFSLYTQILCIPLILPCLGDLALVMKDGPLHTVYSQTEVEQAGVVRANVAPDQIVFGYPAHNSVLTLSGRTMFYGYEGTLHSHGLNYKARKTVADFPENLANCSQLLDEAERMYCPEFIFWGALERSKWPGYHPDSDPQWEPVVPNLLYKLKGS